MSNFHHPTTAEQNADEMRSRSVKAQESMARQQFYGNLIAAYSAHKLNSIEKGVEQTNDHLAQTNDHLVKANKNLTQLNSTASELVGIAGRQLELNKKMSMAMSRIEAQGSEQLKVNQSSLDEQKKQTRLQELQFEFNQAKEVRDEARYEQAELETKRLRAMKDSIHQISRQTTLIKDGDYTALEQYFLVGRLLRAVELILPDDFEEISDKQYRDETEDTIRRDMGYYEALLSPQDMDDLRCLHEIESVDEDEIAEALLAKCKTERAENEVLTRIRSIVNVRTELDIATTALFLQELAEAFPTDNRSEYGEEQ